MLHPKINNQASVKPKTVHTTRRLLDPWTQLPGMHTAGRIHRIQNFFNAAAPFLHDLSNANVKMILCSTHRKPGISCVCMGWIKNEINMGNMDKRVTAQARSRATDVFLFGLFFYIISLSICVPCIEYTEKAVHVLNHRAHIYYCAASWPATATCLSCFWERWIVLNWRPTQLSSSQKRHVSQTQEQLLYIYD